MTHSRVGAQPNRWAMASGGMARYWGIVRLVQPELSKQGPKPALKTQTSDTVELRRCKNRSQARDRLEEGQEA